MTISLRSELKKAALIAAFFYVLVCALVWWQQRAMIYHPHHNAGAPAEYGLKDFTVETLQDDDSTHIRAWRNVARDGYPTIVFFHGNGGDLSFLAPYFSAIAEEGFGLIAIDYRGYGASEGVPSEQGLYQDAQTALEFATQKAGLNYEQIILYGESLGSGVAVQMATEAPVAAVVLQSPFTSLEDVGKDRYPFLPVRLLLEDRFDSLNKIQDVHSKLLIMHGTEDTTVPAEEGRELFAAANEPKDVVYFEGRGHNDLDIAQRIDALVEFSRKYGLIAELKP